MELRTIKVATTFSVPTHKRDARHSCCNLFLIVLFRGIESFLSFPNHLGLLAHEKQPNEDPKQHERRAQQQVRKALLRTPHKRPHVPFVQHSHGSLGKESVANLKQRYGKWRRLTLGQPNETIQLSASRRSGSVTGVWLRTANRVCVFRRPDE